MRGFTVPTCLLGQVMQLLRNVKCPNVSIVGLERIHQVTNTIRIANIGWRIRICIREYTFFSEAINFIRQCSKFHTVIMLTSNKSIYQLLK